MLKTITKNNILSWYQVNSDAKENVINELNKPPCRSHALVFCKGDKYSLYLNFEVEYGVAGNLSLYIENGNESIHIPATFAVMQSSENVNQIQVSFELNINILGEYCFVIKKDNSRRFISQNCLFCNELKEHSNLFSFNSTRNIESFPFKDNEGETPIVLRLLATKSDIDIEQTIKQYREASTRNLRNSFFDTDKLYNLSMRKVREDFISAMSFVFIKCDEIYINGIGVTTKKPLSLSKREDNLYNLELSFYENSKILTQ